MGDRYGGEWPRERFRIHGIEYVTAPMSRSDYYLTLPPALKPQAVAAIEAAFPGTTAGTPGRIELLDNRRLISQLCSLERRVGRSGRDSVDHPAAAGSHDDLINAAAIALVAAALVPKSSADNWLEYYRRLSEKATPASGSDRVRVHMPAELEVSTVYGISGSAYSVEIGSDGRRTVMMSPNDAKALVCSPLPSSSWREVNPDLSTNQLEVIQ